MPISANARKRKSRGRILVVDDESQVRVMLRDILEEAGYEVFEAEDGRKGVQAFDKLTPNLLITDIIMPVQEGVETIVQIRRKHPDAKIIGMSGGGRTANFDFLKLADDFGADRILQKPIELDVILQTVKEALAGA